MTTEKAWFHLERKGFRSKMEFGFNPTSNLTPNRGWSCDHCGKRFFGEGSVGRIMQHLRRRHPLRWMTRRWAIRSFQ